VRALEVPGRAEQLDLPFLGEPRGHPGRVVRAEAQAPRGARITLGNGEDHLPEGVHPERVPAEPPGLQNPVEARLGEPGVELGAVVAGLLRLVGLRPDGGDQRLGAGDDGLRRQARLGHRDLRGPGSRALFRLMLPARGTIRTEGRRKRVGCLLWHTTETDTPAAVRQ
jgi:hypothetical protein